jgi:hypothetical protein
MDVVYYNIKNFLNYNMHINAKLAYLLCTCGKFGDAFMSELCKQYEGSKTVATRHYFNLCINLYEPTSELYKDRFAVSDSNFKFAGSDDPLLAETLQLHNNEVLSWEMVKIYENLKKQNISLDAYQIVGLYTVASLIKYYKDAGFKYIFIPITLDYGRTSHILHQTALLIDFEGRFLFYDPYGTYQKHEKDYGKSVCEFFHVFDDCSLFGDSTAPDKPACVTYHEFFGVGYGDGGIQNILLNRNNARVSSFNKEYDQTVAEIKEEFPTFDLSDDDATQDTQDHTFKILDLLFKFDYANINKTLTSDGGKLTTYERLLHKVLEHYCCYNSKTCVTITLVEMNEFFKYTETSKTTNEIAFKINNLYNEFKITAPNKILMSKLNSLLNIFKNSEELSNIITNSNHISETCSRLFTK